MTQGRTEPGLERANTPGAGDYVTRSANGRSSGRLGRCGVCHAPTLTGAICATHWGRLTSTMDRARDVAPMLDAGPARAGEVVRRLTTRPLPISVPVMEARAALSEALAAAVRELCPGVPRLVIPDAVRLLRAHEARLRGSWVAPVLLVELEPAVAAAVRAVDRPRGRMSVPGRCRECGPSMLHPVGGLLECDRCSARHTVGEVRRAG